MLDNSSVALPLYVTFVASTLTAEEVRAKAIAGDVVVTCVHLSPIPGVRTVRVSPVPLSLAHFARARLVLSLGGLGLTSACLAMGVPQVILPVDAEKAFNAAAAARTGAARVLARDDPADALAEALVAAMTDPTFAARARALAPDFAARLARPPAEVARERLLTLIKS